MTLKRKRVEQYCRVYVPCTYFVMIDMELSPCCFLSSGKRGKSVIICNIFRFGREYRHRLIFNIRLEKFIIFSARMVIFIFSARVVILMFYFCRQINARRQETAIVLIAYRWNGRGDWWLVHVSTMTNETPAPSKQKHSSEKRKCTCHVLMTTGYMILMGYDHIYRYDIIQSTTLPV